MLREARGLQQVRGGLARAGGRAFSAESSSARATAAAGSGATSISPRPRSHVSRPTTGVPFLIASAISDSVPHSPPMATTASAARTTRPLRSSPMPVGIATVTNGFAVYRWRDGSRPTVMPPAACAPRHAASMTPPKPPQTRIAPGASDEAPTSSAARRSSAAPPASRPRRCRCTQSPPVPVHDSAHDEVDQLARDDDLLDHLAPVHVRPHVGRLAAQRRQLLLRRAGVAPASRSRTLPLTWQTSWKVSRARKAGSASGHGSSHTRSPNSRS